ncbi:precorrin-3B C(17)-methyltransferase [Dissulfurirhabdus thermomarina]|uniref:precorrin-3B C(17)-methyltransferase n=1 Tax=Dissulfurirhabdus thermomarina TaxID=1765737 RepID=UPI0031B64D83
MRAGTARLDVVGIGPGDPAWLPPAAAECLRAAEVVVGYKTYVDLLAPVLRPGQEVHATGMRQEVDRCRFAVDQALSGRRVALVCSGDPGIYALAGLVFEVLRTRPEGAGLPVRVVPGISALNACAALLGAPLVHDFAVVSLSDLLTPWEVIRRRVEAAAAADFVLVLYNPRSRRRVRQLGEAVEILLRHRPEATPAGVVRRAARGGEEVRVLTLGELAGADVDMQTTVIVGNSRTFTWNGRMVTPRGYEAKYRLDAPGGADGGETA